jgi:hypothetical protein
MIKMAADYCSCTPKVLKNQSVLFLGGLAKLRKRLSASSCLSVCMEVPGSHWKDFHKI